MSDSGTSGYPKRFDRIERTASVLAAVLLGMVVVVSVSSCSEDGACVDSNECRDGAACISNMSARGTCLAVCASRPGCADGEFCLPRVEEAENVVLVWPNVCVPSEMLLPFEPTPTGCVARSLDDCEADSDCTVEVGWRLDRSRRCRERVPAGCLSTPVVCLAETIFAHNTEGEIFYFSSNCGLYRFARLSPEPGDPLYEELFGVEPTVHSWPACD